MTETLAHGYLSDSTQRELFNEYQHDRISMVFQKSLSHCALEESSLSIGRVDSGGGLTLSLLVANLVNMT